MSCCAAGTNGCLDLRRRATALGAEGQGFVVEVDFQLTFSFLVVEMEDCRHRFRGAEL